MSEEIRKFLNNETYILAYRSNYDSAREVNQKLIDYVNDLQKQNAELKEELEKQFKSMSAIIRHNSDLYLEESNKLIKERQQLKQENQQLKHILDELEKDLKENIEDGRSKENVWLMGCYDEDKRILDKTKKLRGIENENKM